MKNCTVPYERTDYDLQHLEKVFISIITPFYNTPSTLFERCANSVGEQLYEWYEWIIVDDGSDLLYKNELDEYEKKLRYVRIIHQPNSGPSAARNVGIKNAKGEYIAFLDSDDTISEDYLKKMVDCIGETRPDIIFSNLLLCKRSGEVVQEKKNRNNTELEVNECDKRRLLNFMFDDNHGLANSFSGMYVSSDVYCKMIKTLIAKNVMFDQNLMNGEDQIFMANCVLKSNRIASTTDGSYCYTIDYSDSITHSYTSRTMQYILNFIKSMDLLFSNNRELFTKKYLRSIQNLTSLIFVNTNMHSCIAEYKKLFENAYIESLNNILFQKANDTRREKIWKFLIKNKAAYGIYMCRLIMFNTRKIIDSIKTKCKSIINKKCSYN